MSYRSEDHEHALVHQNSYDGPSKGTPIIRNLYLSPRRDSITSFIATNSAPNTDVSIVDCRFENHLINAVLMKTKYPDLDLRVSFSPA